MKKIVFAISLLLCAQATFAQLEKGMIAVGIGSNITNFKYTSENSFASVFYSHKSKSTSYSILPSVNYFISNKYSIGLLIGYRRSTLNDQSNSTNTTNSFASNGNYNGTNNGITISPNIKYYIPLNDKIYFFLNGSCNTLIDKGTSSRFSTSSYTDPGTGIIQNDEYSNAYKTKTQQITVGISPGILFIPSKKIGLEFSLGNLIAYNYQVGKTTNVDSDYTSKSTTNGLDFIKLNTFSLNTGLNFFF